MHSATAKSSDRADAPPADASAFAALVRRRRATPEFLPEPVPREEIEEALHIAAEAPSGYNLQPWRYLVLRSPEARARLRAAAFDQEKITEAPLVIVATAHREAWRQPADEILRTQAIRTGRDPDDTEKREKAKASAFAFIDQLPREVWLTRQVMIGFTYLMLGFESLGWDTAPMEGFDAEAVRGALGLPADTEIVALLAVGRAAEPGKRHPGRLPLERIAFEENDGTPWRSEG
jgi:nitroreductase